MPRMYTVTPSQAITEIVACMSAGRPPLLLSSPGMGKSSLVREIANTYNLKLIDRRLSQCTPEDLQGFPMRTGNKATFTPFDIFPIEGDEIPEGYAGWLLFLDELTSASKPVQAAAYKLILDRMTGSFKLHDNVAIVAAGNKLTDKAVVNQMSTALQSRMIHYELELNSKDWIDYAHKKKIDHRIIGFLEYMPSKLMDFKPDHQDSTFACPRTWEFLSDLIKNEDVSEKLGARISGTVGEGTAVEFITFAREYLKLPKFRDILKDPDAVPVPDEASTKYACVSMLIDNFDPKTLDPVLKYLNKFQIEFQIVFARGAFIRHPKIRENNPAFREYMVKMVRYLE